MRCEEWTTHSPYSHVISLVDHEDLFNVGYVQSVAMGVLSICCTCTNVGAYQVLALRVLRHNVPRGGSALRQSSLLSKIVRDPP